MFLNAKVCRRWSNGGMLGTKVRNRRNEEIEQNSGNHSTEAKNCESVAKTCVSQERVDGF